jgi:putative phosphoribosyl transferase
MRYDDRRSAGRQLAGHLERLRDQDVVVLGLPRGGVPVAYEVARALDAPLDVLVVRKLGVPWQPELGFGAIGEHGVRVLNRGILSEAGLDSAQQADVEEAERAELDRRVHSYRQGRAPLPVTGRTAVVVDDGLATGATAEAACRVVRGQGAGRVVLAVPVGPASTVAGLRQVADEVICPETVPVLGSVGAWYDDFTQTSDREVVSLLAEAAHSPADPPPNREVTVPAGGVPLGARLVVPDGARAVVAFAHGSGSSRHSPRNRHVATMLNRAGLATLLLDLLTDGESGDRSHVFDIPLLAQRLHAAAQWVSRETALPVAYFGASTGAAAALEAAALPGSDIRAVVSRGGRPDLAAPDALTGVRAPVLLIVGSRDTRVLSLNRLAADRMHCPHQIAVVPGATHLFEEPGALDTVARLARDWFTAHLDRPAAAATPPRRSA